MRKRGCTNETCREKRDKPAETPAACGAADKPTETPAACGAADKPEEKPAELPAAQATSKNTQSGNLLIVPPDPPALTGRGIP